MGFNSFASLNRMLPKYVLAQNYEKNMTSFYILTDPSIDPKKLDETLRNYNGSCIIFVHNAPFPLTTLFAKQYQITEKNFLTIFDPANRSRQKENKNVVINLTDVHIFEIGPSLPKELPPLFFNSLTKQMINIVGFTLVLNSNRLFQGLVGSIHGFQTINIQEKVMEEQIGKTTIIIQKLKKYHQMFELVNAINNLKITSNPLKKTQLSFIVVCEGASESNWDKQLKKKFNAKIFKFVNGTVVLLTIYEGIIFKIKDNIIMANLNTDKTGKKPFFIFPLNKKSIENDNSSVCEPLILYDLPLGVSTSKFELLKKKKKNKNKNDKKNKGKNENDKTITGKNENESDEKSKNENKKNNEDKIEKLN